MTVYTYSEARQHLANVLNEAKSSGKVVIRRKDGSLFSIIPEKKSNSPFDVPSLKTKISLDTIISSIRTSREREYRE